MPGGCLWSQRLAGSVADGSRCSVVDNFRQEYNELRPHEALGMRTPSSVWHPSSRAYNPNPPAWDYDEGAEMRKVNGNGTISIGNINWKIAQALATEWVQLKRIDQRVLVFYCRTLVREIDLNTSRSTAVDRDVI